ncbi:histidine kinase [Saccharospirillum sp. MSK14-1]|uniref:HDOD domain-containing protein n=1 Tax=Saccharospirillum sp. MSK14-1 TaxID=1897632 RepID=UPI000D352631|nr:HDOD domain-containing protein [Saccharospirillum sp. MSK14-1]PTY38930.1 histidine kinase [Saccharospirillum sp. MSK14-1]
MSSLVDTVNQDILDALNSDQLFLPSLPEVALQIRSTAENPDATIKDLVDIISQDSALSARIIRVVNSPLLRAPQEVRDLAMAISRLGMNYSCNLAIGLAMEQMFRASNPQIDQRLRQLWRLTGDVSALASVLARHTGAASADEALLAGLIHRLGALPILSYTESHPELIADDATLTHVIDQLHGSLGQIILQSWDFPSSFCGIPIEYRQFDRQPAQSDLVDLVMVANLMAHNDGNSGWSNKDWHTIAAFNRLDIPADRDDEIISQLYQLAASARAIFA